MAMFAAIPEILTVAGEAEAAYSASGAAQFANAAEAGEAAASGAGKAGQAGSRSAGKKANGIWEQLKSFFGSTSGSNGGGGGRPPNGNGYQTEPPDDDSNRRNVNGKNGGSNSNNNQNGSLASILNRVSGGAFPGANGGGGGGNGGSGGGGTNTSTSPAGENPKFKTAVDMLEKAFTDLTGPIGKTAVEIAKLPGAIAKYSSSLLEEQRGLSPFNGDIASSFAGLDSGRKTRKAELGAATSSTFGALSDSQNRLEKAMIPGQAGVNNLNNFAATVANNIGERIAGFFAPLGDMVSKWTSGVTAEEAAKFTTNPMNETLSTLEQKLQNDARRSPNNTLFEIPKLNK